MIVSESEPPPLNPFYHSWERGLDPWHEDAFPAEFKSSASHGLRKTGWFAVDWCGNYIAWVPDGTETRKESDDENS